MEKKYHFYENKFRSLPEMQQHKKCMEQLRKMHEMYSQMIMWMEQKEAPLESLNELHDRFHDHADRAEIHIKEESLLPLIRRGDLEVAKPFLPIHIFLDRLRSAHNVGSIIRTTEALRLGSIYYSESMIVPDEKSINKSAMGAQTQVGCHQGIDLKTLPRPIIALETAVLAKDSSTFIFPKTAFTLVVGNEEEGCSDTTLQLCDEVIHIPLYGKKNSLNVACAFAIVAAQISNQVRSHD